MVKVARFRLICKQTDLSGAEIDYKEIYRLLWELQKQTRVLKNKAIQICWDFQNRSIRNHDETGEYLKDKEEFGMSLRGYLNHQLKDDTILYSGNVCATTDTAYH